jgi:3-oxoacyl-[acyl-carrier protein] reductase
MKIEGKTALVAGATRGIGLAIARRLAAAGVRLVMPWYDWPEDCRAVMDEFSQLQGRHIFVEADLRNNRDVKKLFAVIQKETEALHIVVNNMERGGMPVVHGSYSREINHDQWQLEMDTTLLAKRFVFENALPLLKNAAEATVINISSIAGIIGRSGPAGLLFSDGYAAANRGVGSLTETWARLGAPTVRVNEVMLGLIDTRHGKHTRGWEVLSKQEKADLLRHSLLGRTGTPGEVAETVMFLIQNADFMTGSVIRLDGGYVAGGDKVPPMPDGVVCARP